MAMKPIDDAKPTAAGSAGGGEDTREDADETSGLPGRPMALLLAVGLALLAALVAWLLVGGIAAFAAT